MKIAIVNCFISNEMRVKSVYDYFVNRGHSVLVFESDFLHLTKTYRSNPPKDYVYIPTVSYKKNLSIRRLYSHSKFSNNVIKELNQYDFDLIYALIPPNSLVKDLIQYKKSKRIKVIFDVIDLWPESLPVAISKNLFPFVLWKRLRSEYINEADYIITQCDLYQSYLNVDEIKRKTIYFCKEKQQQIVKNKEYSKEQIVLAYLGSMNHLIDIEQIGQIIKVLMTKYKVIVHVIGTGVTTDKFLTMLEQKGASIQFYGEVYDSETLAEIFSQCDFGLNVYKATTCIGMTTKSIDYFSYHLPIINTIPCDTERLIKKYNAGINVKDFSVEKVEEYRKQEKRIDELVEEEFSPAIFQTRMDEIMGKLFHQGGLQ